MDIAAKIRNSDNEIKNSMKYDQNWDKLNHTRLISTDVNHIDTDLEATKD